FATTASHRALFACSSCSSRTKSLLESRREAFRLRLFHALLFLLTVLFDIAAEDPTRQSSSICPSALDLTQNTILGKFLHRWSTGSFFASNRKYLIGANAGCSDASQPLPYHLVAEDHLRHPHWMLAEHRSG